MRRTLFSFLTLILAIPAVANAANFSWSLGSVQNTIMLQPGQAGQTVNLYLLLDPGDQYITGDLYGPTNGGVGPAPRITHVFNTTMGSISAANLASSIWVNGGGGVASDETNSTYPTASGLEIFASFGTQATEPRFVSGIFATLTFDTTGVPAGQYALDLSNSLVTFALDEFLDPIPLEVGNRVLYFGCPEPSAIVLGLLAAVGLGAVALRRRRAA